MNKKSVVKARHPIAIIRLYDFEDTINLIQAINTYLETHIDINGRLTKICKDLQSRIKSQYGEY